MRYNRLRTTLALVIAVPLAIVVFGCASAQHDPSYDGALEIPDSPSDSAMFVPVHIENHRTIDALPPTIYLNGSGRHSLGRIEGMGGKIDRLVDTSWFDPSGCMQISAHYAGSGDLIFDRFCWRKGERIEATLDNVFNPIAAWAHR